MTSEGKLIASEPVAVRKEECAGADARSWYKNAENDN